MRKNLLLSPFATLRRRRRYDVERFRLLYSTLLCDIAPPPLPPPSSPLPPVDANDGGDEVSEERQRQHQQGQQQDGGEEPSEGQSSSLSSSSSSLKQTPAVISAIDPSADLSADLSADAAAAPAVITGPTTAPSEPSSQQQQRQSPSRYGGGDDQQREVRRRNHSLSDTASAAAARRHGGGLTEEAAWHILSATPNPFKEGSSEDTALAVRDDASVAILAAARALETRVVETMRSLGEAVVAQTGGDYDGRDNDNEEVWTYFCDKNILALLVDIAKAKAPPSMMPDAEQHHQQQQEQQFGGVVWTPSVKVQVLETISTLLTNAKDDTSLYFLLSNNHVNELTAFFVPMSQWTDQALEEMMPHYIGFLKSLSLKLVQSPHLFQFFVNEGTNTNGETLASLASESLSVHSSMPSPSNAGRASLARFPLLHSSIQVLSSAFAKSDAFVHVTALNIILNLCQIPLGHIRTAIGEMVVDQQILLSHLCQRLVSRYRRIAHMTVGVASGDASRSSALGKEIADLQDQLHFVNDLLWCGIRPLNVRACEYILRRVLFQAVLPGLLMHKRKSVSSRVDPDCCPIPDDPIVKEGEGMAQASVVFLTQLFLTLEYAPLLKMTAVAVLHPYSPANWTTLPKTDGRGDEYVLTSALNAIVNGKCTVIKKGISQSELGAADDGSNKGTDGPSMHAVNNPYRSVVISLVRSDMGYRRFIPAAMLLQSILDAEDLDCDFLGAVSLLSTYSTESSDETETTASDFESALSAFFTRTHRPSWRASLAIECGGSLALSMLSHLIVAMTSNGRIFEYFHGRFVSSPLVVGIAKARAEYATQTKKISRAAELSDSFMDLIELEMSRRYVLVPGENGSKQRVCDLNANDVHNLMKNSAELLVEKMRETSIMDALFAIRAMLYFLSMGRVLVDMHQRLSSFIGPHSLSSRWGADAFEISTVDVIESEYLELGGQKERPALGTDLDVRGRTFFYFTPSLTGINPHQAASDRKRRLAQELISMAKPGQSELLIVLDPTDLFVLKPNLSDGSCNRGTILCCASIDSVIAAVPDKEWLHIAVRQTEDVGIFIRNGNMSLRFDSVGTCLIVKQYLERCRSALCSKKMTNIDRILDDCTSELFLDSSGHGKLSAQQERGDSSSVQNDKSIVSDDILGEGEEEIVLENPTEGNVAGVSC